MENKTLKITNIILLILVLLMGGYIIYDKVLNNKQLPSADHNPEKTELNYNEIYTEVKNKFDFAFNYFESVISYCGEHQSSDRTIEATGANYNVSTQFNTYNEMYNYLRSYMSDNVITSKKTFTIDKKNYLEEDGKLYCATFNKGGIYTYGDSTLEIESIEDNKIIANAVKELIDPQNTKSYKKITLTLENDNNNYIITSYEVQD